MSSMDDRTATSEEMFSDDDIRDLARKAVARLIADAKSGRLDQGRELVDVLEGCICQSSINRIRDLKWLLQQQELERPDLQT
jgi:hypothetical protein